MGNEIIRRKSKVDTFLLDVTENRLIQRVSVKSLEQLLSIVPDFGDYAIRRNVSPTDNRIDCLIDVVWDVPKHLCVVSNHLPLDGVRREWLFRLD